MNKKKVKRILYLKFSEALEMKFADIEDKLKQESNSRNEAIIHLETILDTQIKNVQGQIRKEEIARAQQELVLKSDIIKLAEQLRTDYEVFKSQQNQ